MNHSSKLHCDLISYQPLADLCKLLKRVDPDDPEAERDGTYVFATTPHTIEECAFKDLPHHAWIHGTDLNYG